MTIIVFIGMPCSGKSTIARYVSDVLKIPYVSSGDIARHMAMTDPLIHDMLNMGSMAPEEMMRSEIAKRCIDARENRKDVILDGFPRFHEQLIWLKKTFPNDEILCVFISVTMNTVFQRNELRGRDDSQSIHERVKYFVQNTYPIISEMHRILTFVNDMELTQQKLWYIAESVRKEL